MLSECRLHIVGTSNSLVKVRLRYGCCEPVAVEIANLRWSRLLNKPDNSANSTTLEYIPVNFPEEGG